MSDSITNKIAVVAASLFLGLFAAWLYGEKKAAREIVPSGNQTNLVAFLHARPPTQIRRFIYKGKLHVEVTRNPAASLMSLQSGPAAYVFDDSGALVDWSRDLGDAPSFVNKWGGFGNATPISIQEAAELVKAH